MLKKWEELPYFMQTEEVRPYYEKLQKKRFSLVLKRIFDFTVSSVMLVILSPALLILAILIKWDSEGPVFYRQERITQYGRKFRIYKFRTMVVNADRIGSLVTVGEDPRITKIGKRLRGCRLDELPQLINIWKGEMTFVGTRPEVEKYVKEYSPEMMATLLLPAGVTSEASIQYKDEDKLLKNVSGEEADRVYVEKILPEKMKWNLREMKRFGFIREIGTMVRTVVAMI